MVIELVQYLRPESYSVRKDRNHISCSINSIKRYGLLISFILVLVANATTFPYTSADTIVVPPTSSMTNRSSSTVTPITISPPSGISSTAPPTTSAVTISSSTVNITTTTQQPQTQNLPAPSPNTLSGITTSGPFTASTVIPSVDILGGSQVPVYP